MLLCHPHHVLGQPVLGVGIEPSPKLGQDILGQG